jgi:hypothetical protein
MPGMPANAARWRTRKPKRGTSKCPTSASAPALGGGAVTPAARAIKRATSTALSAAARRGASWNAETAQQRSTHLLRQSRERLQFGHAASISHPCWGHATK